MQTKGAIGNLINRYQAVLKKCHLLNTLGALTLASAFVLGGAASALSDTIKDTLKTAHSLTGVTYENQNPAFWAVTSRSEITDSRFSANTNTDNPYGMGGVFYFQAPGETIFTNSSFVNNVLETKGENAYAGVLFDKGTVISLNDVQFSGNKAVVNSDSAKAWGGAIYADAAINDKVGVKEAILNFNVTRDMTYSGNTIEVQDTSSWLDSYGSIGKSSGGFLFLDRSTTANFNISDGATLTIGSEDASGHMDSIASSLSLDESAKAKGSTLAKKGGGTLTVNSQLNDFYGHVAVQKGTMNVTKDWDVKNDISVSGDCGYAGQGRRQRRFR